MMSLDCRKVYREKFVGERTLEDYVPEGHMARLVYELVEGLDTSSIEDKYSELGQNTYHCKVLLRLLFYGHATGVRNGKK